MSPARIEAARDAFAGVVAARQVTDTERGKLASLKARRVEGLRLREQKNEEAARRLLSDDDGDQPHGNTAAARKAKQRDERLSALDDEIPALGAAIRLQEQRIAAAKSAIDEPHLPFVGAVVDVVAETQGGAVDEIRAGLAALAPAFAQLVAGDQIRAATIGNPFALPDGKAPPIGGVPLFLSFANGLPKRLRPAELAETALLSKAAAISSNIVQQIKGEAP